jgi:DNA-binding NarL/FixJ family response regulator
MAADRITIVLADDHAVVRHGLRLVHAEALSQRQSSP